MTGRPAVALAAPLAGLAVVMAVWLSIDRRPPEWDHANHLERAVLCQRSLTESSREALQEIIAESSFYPPIVTCAAGLLDPVAGLLAAFLFATAPFVVFSLTNFQLDLPLAAMVVLALYSLARTEALSARLARLLAALGVAALIALPWYGPRLVGLPMQVLNRSFKQAAESGHAPALTSGALLFYPRWIVPQLGLLATLLPLGGAVALARHERARLGVDAGPGPAPFTLRADGVSYGGVRLPALLVHWIVRNFDPTPRLRRLPMAVSVAPISVGAGRLEVGTDPDLLCLPKESR